MFIKSRNSVFWVQDRVLGLFYMFYSIKFVWFVLFFFILMRDKCFLWNDYWVRWFSSQWQAWSFIFEMWMLAGNCIWKKKLIWLYTVLFVWGDCVKIPLPKREFHLFGHIKKTIRDIYLFLFSLHSGFIQELNVALPMLSANY